jgi:1-acyl-sn-glycerol-3-phosphate acyltransferase
MLTQHEPSQAIPISAERSRPGTVEVPASATTLLEIARSTLAELRQQDVERIDCTLDSTLDGDLALDSLARVELFARIERAFSVSLPSALFAEALTLRDIERALKSAAAAAPAATTTMASATRSRSLISAPPNTLMTLDAVLAWHVEQHADFTQITICGEAGEERLTYADLWRGARRIASGLQGQGVRAGDAVALMLPTSPSYFLSFFGVLLAGGTPVPLYPPARPNQIAEHVRRHAEILRNCGAVALITDPQMRRVAGVLRMHAPALRRILTEADFAAGVAEPTPVSLATSATALLQYTSGSTGQPKGVMLSHANLLANVRALGVALRIVNTDVFVSWLPLYHDMGLIGAWLGSFYFGIPLVVMSPLTFLRRPQRWLEAIQQFGGTVSAAPNFAYELCLKHIDDATLARLDLRSWRLALNGAEAVMPATLERFRERFAPCGLQASVLTPVYGLAECSVGLTIPPLGRAPRIDVIDRERFVREGVAVPAAAAAQNPLRFVACGVPLRGHAVSIRDGRDHEVGERIEGRVEFCGPSATAGYLANPEATTRLRHGEWLDSGDRGYIADGEIYITGRNKDIIIRAGRNIYPEELETAIGDIAGVRKGCVAAFGSMDSERGTERLIVLVETQLDAPERRAQLRQQVIERSLAILGEAPDDIVLVSPHTVLKTSSGKIRRAASRDLFESGRMTATQPPPPWRQLAHLWLDALRFRAHRRWHRTLDLVQGVQIAIAFVVVAIGLVPCLVGSRSTAQCWSRTHAAARRFVRWSRIPFSVEGEENLRLSGGAVIVANHASYLDGVFLMALLPTPCRVVVKRELAKAFLVGRLLRRLDAEFVERFDKAESVAGAHHLASLAERGKPCLVFPEGTFTRAPGLLPFHLGAFASAVRANVPVLPIALRGTRSLLREGQWLVHRGPVALHAGACLVSPPEGDAFKRTVALRDAARRAILEHCGEPDLCGS